MFVSFRLLVVESIGPNRPTELFRYPLDRAIRHFATPRLYTEWVKNLDWRVSATPPSRWTITPLFYSQSTDLPVLRGRRAYAGH